MMGTVVTIDIVHDPTHEGDTPGCPAPVTRAFDWFRLVEACCSRFDPASELMSLTSHIGEPVAVSPILYEALSFALAVAAASDGAFDPTVGRRMEVAGFNRHYQTGAAIDSRAVPTTDVTYADVHLDPSAGTVTLRRPLVLDLGAVAKGLAIDLAVRELSPLANFCVDAGGDIYVAGTNAKGHAWSVGIRDPGGTDELIDRLHVSNRAVCTSGGYERRTPDNGGHHLLHPATGLAVDAVASVTVVAPTALMADALATAAFVMAADRGAEGAATWLSAQGVDGLVVSASLERHATTGLGAWR
ncbi:MAG: FAD:protein FMN transferase [Vicinamibacterales bacterium]